MFPKTRKLALDILDLSEKKSGFVSGRLARAASEKNVNYQLLQRLVKGTIEWKGRIDEIIVDVSGGESKNFPPDVRNVLRLAAYQLCFLKGAPVDLVLSESMAILEAARLSKFSGQVAALLKTFSTYKPQRNRKLTDAASVASYYSHPEWLIKRLIPEIGIKETILFCEANNRPWPVCVRTNLLKISTRQLRKKLSDERVRWSETRYVKDCTLIVSLPRGKRLHQLESFREGLFQVQDESAVLVGLMSAARPGQFAMDLCAAPGGKTTHIASLMKNRGRILALDLQEARLKPLRENVKRLGLRIVEARAGDALKLEARPADLVLLDAPCSGLGTLGRKGDIRFAKSESTVAELTDLQTRLIEKAAQLVRPGGKLVYSTCTVEKAENEGIVEMFLSRHKDFKIVPPPEDLDKSLFSSQGFLRTWPQRHNMGGAFAAVLEKSTHPLA